MNPLVVVGIMVVAVALMVGLLYLMRRLVPTTGLLVDVGRANALYGLVCTAFAVLLAFVVFVGFQSFNQGRSAAEREAVAVMELFRTAGFFPAPEGDVLQGQIACYARAAVREWRPMSDGRHSRVVDMWVGRMQRTWARLPLDSPTAQAAFSNLTAADDVRTTGRRERLAERRAVVSTPVWFTLAVGGVIVVLTAVLYADPRERFVVQAFLLSAVTVMVVAGLVLVWFLDLPFEDSTGSIKSTEMQRSIVEMEGENPGLPALCSLSGRPVPA
ncbi:MAG TPA: hypothetical protein VHF45_13290 [Thermoleophilaceae bacterium]|nr:hypothetical protein [Thermoleophilaceae bacterium]